MILTSNEDQICMLGQVIYHDGQDETLQTIHRFSGKHSGTSIMDLLFYLLVYKTEEID